jgi:Lon protease-like protein
LPRTYRKASELPSAIPVFPLGGALLFPRASLPLNIFEPRYLAMVDAALASHRLIGMIQPAAMFGPNASLEDDRPALSRVGCAGRITAYQETDDGRYLIVLTGVSRFKLGEELPSGAPYRLFRTDWKPFEQDLAVDVGLDDSARARLLAALKSYLRRGEFKADWEAVEAAPLDALINSLSAGCPFTNAEKQALLEARTTEDRCAALITLLEMERPGQGGGYVQ